MIGVALALSWWIAAPAAGGQTPEDRTAIAGSLPENHEQLLKTYLDGALKDPMSAQIKLVRGPRLGTLTTGGWLTGKKTDLYWIVCYGVNAKNSYGGYSGQHLYALLIQRSALVRVISDDAYRNRDLEQECARPEERRPPGWLTQPQ